MISPDVLGKSWMSDVGRALQIRLGPRFAVCYQTQAGLVETKFRVLSRTETDNVGSVTEEVWGATFRPHHPAERCAPFALRLHALHCFSWSLRCHPLTCILLKLRLGVDSSPT